MTKIYCILLVPLSLIPLKITAQKNTVAAGGEGQGSSGTISFSVGQTDYKIATGSGGSAQQGVQQPYEIFAITNVENEHIQLFLANVYPNPFRDFVTLSLSGLDYSMCHYVVYDLQGKLIDERKINSSSTNIALNDFAAGTYLLKVKNSEVELKSFKIIKSL